MRFIKINEHYTETDCKQYRVTNSPNSARPHQIYFKSELIGFVKTKGEVKPIILKHKEGKK